MKSAHTHYPFLQVCSAIELPSVFLGLQLLRL